MPRPYWPAVRSAAVLLISAAPVQLSPACCFSCRRWHHSDGTSHYRAGTRNLRAPARTCPLTLRTAPAAPLTAAGGSRLRRTACIPPLAAWAPGAPSLPAAGTKDDTMKVPHRCHGCWSDAACGDGHSTRMSDLQAGKLQDCEHGTSMTCITSKIREQGGRKHECASEVLGRLGSP